MRESSESHFTPDAKSGPLPLAELEQLARSNGTRPALSLREWVALAEAWRIAQALREARGNRSAAARALGIGRRTLYSKMEKLGLEPTWGVSWVRVAGVRRATPGEAPAAAAPQPR